MNTSTRFSNKPLILLSFTLAFFVINQQSFSQTPITNVTASYVDIDDASNDYSINGNGGTYSTATTFNVQHTSTTTTNNNLVLMEYSIGGNTYVPFLLSDQININRVDNTNVTGNRGIVFHERESFASPNLKISSEYATQMEDVLNSTIINRGADNVFANDGGPHINNIERIDYVWTGGGLQSPNPDLSGFVIVERGGNDPFKAAAILTIDAAGQPTSYGALITVASSNWGNTGFSIPTTVFVKDDTDANFLPSGDVGSQNINAIYLSFTDLGIATNTVTHGYSLFANDVNTASHDLLNVNTFPLLTSGASGQGGIDLVGGGGSFSEDGTLTSGPLPVADLSLTKTINNATPKIGETITFTLVLTNSGPSFASEVQVEDVLPTGLIYDFANSTIPAGTTYDNATGLWDLSNATINNGDTFTLQIAATVTPTCGEITNTAQIITNDFTDPDSVENNGN